MIDFQEDDTDGYVSRTIKNASADVTLAFAVDFETAGERLTKKSVIQQGKIYIPITISIFESSRAMGGLAKFVTGMINDAKNEPITLNIAGNGIYRLKDTFIKNQKTLDYFIYQFISMLIDNELKISQIRTGGQSGADEAGAKAGVKLGIPTLVLAPKKWKYRDIDNNDIFNENFFKERFNNQ